MPTHERRANTRCSESFAASSRKQSSASAGQLTDAGLTAERKFEFTEESVIGENREPNVFEPVFSEFRFQFPVRFEDCVLILLSHVWGSCLRKKHPLTTRGALTCPQLIGLRASDLCLLFRRGAQTQCPPRPHRWPPGARGPLSWLPEPAPPPAGAPGAEQGAPAPPHTSSGTPGKLPALSELAASSEIGDDETHTT